MFVFFLVVHRRRQQRLNGHTTKADRNVVDWLVCAAQLLDTVRSTLNEPVGTEQSL